MNKITHADQNRRPALAILGCGQITYLLETTYCFISVLAGDLKRYSAIRGRTVRVYSGNELEYPACSCRSLRRRATVALMTGCEALRTMYRIGFKWQQEDPSENPPPLRARDG